MYISKIKIQNYRNFVDFEMKLNPFTLIIGENNIGKTNILNAIGLIFSHEIIAFKKRLLEIDDINYSMINIFKNEIINYLNENIEEPEFDFPTVSVEVDLKDFDDDQEAVVSDWFIDDKFDTARLKYTFTYRKNKIEWYKKTKQSIEDKKNKVRRELGRDEEYYKEKESAFDKEIINLIDFPINGYYYSISGGNETSPVDNYYLRMLKFEFLDALRDAKRELVAGNDYRLLYKVLSNHGFDKFSELKENFQNLNSAIKTNKGLNDILSAIGEYLGSISLKGGSTNNDVQFKFSSIEISEVLKRLSLAYADSPIDVNRNGLGRNNLLYIALVLSQLNKKIQSEDDIFFRIIAIEEPEAHLHAHLQRHLSAGLRVNVDRTPKGKQVILTSHSTHITSKLDLSNTVVLYQDDKILKSHYFMESFDLSKAEGRKQKRFVEKYLDATNSTMFFARKIILVEGSAEEILIPEFFKLKTGKTLEEYGCSLINVRGVAFKNFLEIIKGGYYIKCIVLTDSDIGKNTQNRANKLEEKYNGFKKKIMICKTDSRTFEIDVIEENRTSTGARILLEALKNTRPNNFKKNWETKTTIDTTDFFKEIEPQTANGEKSGDFKADFSYFLSLELKDGFNIPEYIKKGFDFLIL